MIFLPVAAKQWISLWPSQMLRGCQFAKDTCGSLWERGGNLRPYYNLNVGPCIDVNFLSKCVNS